MGPFKVSVDARMTKTDKDAHIQYVLFYLCPHPECSWHLEGSLGEPKAQTLQPSQVLVLDSSSTDGTAEWAKRDGCRVVTVSRAEFRMVGLGNMPRNWLSTRTFSSTSHRTRFWQM